jgi:hypothetical protein
MNIQQLPGAVLVIAMAMFEPGRGVAVVGVELHAEEPVQFLADDGAEAIGRVERGLAGARGQLLQDALGAVAKDGGGARQDVLVEVADTDEAPIAARQMAQHQQRGFVQVLQFVEQYGFEATLQQREAGVEVQCCQLAGQRIGAVAGCIEQRLLGGPARSRS